jgi:hypothetical protein
MNQAPLDRNRNLVIDGDHVKIIEIPERLTAGLPEEDKVAINSQVGKVLIVQGFEKDGSVELEFIDDAGHYHTIWIDPNCLARVAW